MSNQTQLGMKLEDTGGVDWDKQVRELLAEVRQEMADKKLAEKQALAYHKSLWIITQY